MEHYLRTCPGCRQSFSAVSIRGVCPNCQLFSRIGRDGKLIVLADSDFIEVPLPRDEAIDDLLDAWFGNMARVLEAGRGFYIWGGYANLGNYPPFLKKHEMYFRQGIVWDKQHPVLTRKDRMGSRVERIGFACERGKLGLRGIPH